MSDVANQKVRQIREEDDPDPTPAAKVARMEEKDDSSSSGEDDEQSLIESQRKTIASLESELAKVKNEKSLLEQFLEIQSGHISELKKALKIPFPTLIPNTQSLTHMERLTKPPSHEANEPLKTSLQELIQNNIGFGDFRSEMLWKQESEISFGNIIWNFGVMPKELDKQSLFINTDDFCIHAKLVNRLETFDRGNSTVKFTLYTQTADSTKENLKLTNWILNTFPCQHKSLNCLLRDQADLEFVTKLDLQKFNEVKIYVMQSSEPSDKSIVNECLKEIVKKKWTFKWVTSTGDGGIRVHVQNAPGGHLKLMSPCMSSNILILSNCNVDVDFMSCIVRGWVDLSTQSLAFVKIPGQKEIWTRMLHDVEFESFNLENMRKHRRCDIFAKYLDPNALIARNREGNVASVHNDEANGTFTFVGWDFDLIDHQWVSSTIGLIPELDV